MHDVDNCERDDAIHYRIAVIGNSNSIAVTSYARVLAERKNITLKNYSIGGVPNIVLLSFLTNPDVDLSDIDVIIVELAIIEALILQKGNTYTIEQSKDNIDLFMLSVRARSSARVIFLILPTLFGLLEPQRFFAEKHYVDCARLHGATVLNGYEVVRHIGHLDPTGPPPGLQSTIDRFVSVFGLDNSDLLAFRRWLRQHPVELHGPAIGTKPFCEQVFEDPIHVSRPFHTLVADLLCYWISQDSNAPMECSINPSDWVATFRSLPLVENVNPILRESSFLSRQVTPIGVADTATYPCRSDCRAVGILVNEPRTSGFLNFASPLGCVSIDVCFRTWANPWSAMIVLVPDGIGGGDISVTISAQPAFADHIWRHAYLSTTATPREPSAEIGEMLLTTLDWRCELENKPVFCGHAEANIEEQDWARDRIESLSAAAARTVDGLRRSNIAMNRSTFMLCLNMAGADGSEAGRCADKARLLAAAGEFETALSAISVGLSNTPDSPLLLEMRQALTDVIQWDSRS